MTQEARAGAFHSAGTIIIQHLQDAADALAVDFTMERESALALLLNDVHTRLKPSSSPAGGGAMDRRTERWRARFRIYDTRQMDEARADTDEGEPLDAPGAMVIAGLPNVAAEAIALARHWHASQGHLDEGGQLIGMDTATLAHRLKSLRPTISRRGDGTARWSIPYDTFDTIGGTSNKTGWMMRVDIVRMPK